MMLVLEERTSKIINYILYIFKPLHNCTAFTRDTQHILSWYSVVNSVVQWCVPVRRYLTVESASSVPSMLDVQDIPLNPTTQNERPPALFLKPNLKRSWIKWGIAICYYKSDCFENKMVK